jgi:hypothetical protein
MRGLAACLTSSIAVDGQRCHTCNPLEGPGDAFFTAFFGHGAIEFGIGRGAEAERKGVEDGEVGNGEQTESWWEETGLTLTPKRPSRPLPTTSSPTTSSVISGSRIRLRDGSSQSTPF